MGFEGHGIFASGFWSVGVCKWVSGTGFFKAAYCEGWIAREWCLGSVLRGTGFQTSGGAGFSKWLFKGGSSWVWVFGKHLSEEVSAVKGCSAGPQGCIKSWTSPLGI